MVFEDARIIIRIICTSQILVEMKEEIPVMYIMIIKNNVDSIIINQSGLVKEIQLTTEYQMWYKTLNLCIFFSDV